MQVVAVQCSALGMVSNYVRGLIETDSLGICRNTFVRSSDDIIQSLLSVQIRAQDWCHFLTFLAFLPRLKMSCAIENYRQLGKN